MRRFKEYLKLLLVAVFPGMIKKRSYRLLERISWSSPPDEEAEILLMPFFLNQNSTFFDVGANKGLYTRAAEKLINPSNIYSFEPIPELHFALRRMFRKSNIHRIALSDDEGTVRFKIPFIRDIEYKSRGKLNTGYVEEGETRARIIQVNVSMLDSFAAMNKINGIDFIKIDVEGHELKVIRGASDTLKKIHPVLQIEIEQRHHASPMDEIIEEIEKFGYVCHYLDLETKALRQLDREMGQFQLKHHFKTKKYIHNFIFIPSNQEWVAKTSAINRQLANLA